MLETQTECYKHPWLLQEIYRATSGIGSRVTNIERVESRIMNHVGQYLLRDERNIRNRRYVVRLIYQEVHFAINRLRREHATHLADITATNGDGQEVEYEPLDVLANIASGNLEIKETINLLAKDDRRKEFVLNAWANGYMDDTEISHILADVFTGQATGHLSFIKRFRKTCRTELTALAI